MGSATIQDHTVMLAKNNLPVGQNKASPTTWSTTDEQIIYGGPTDLRGSTWTAEEVAATKFGLFFAALRSAGDAEQAKVDHIAIKIYYTESVPPVPNPTLGSSC